MDRRLWMEFPRCLCLRAHMCWYHVIGVEWEISFMETSIHVSVMLIE